MSDQESPLRPLDSSTTNHSDSAEPSQETLIARLGAGRGRKYVRLVAAALGSIPWIGGLIAASASFTAETEQQKLNELQRLRRCWLQVMGPEPVEAASFAPVPIPGGTPVLGGAYHVFGPAAFDPIDAEPATITNLNAFVGLAYVSGMVTQTNTKTGEVVRLPFLNSDMRFMQGVFRGTDGKVHPGAFAFV